MVAEGAFLDLQAAVRRVAAPHAPLPFATSQERYYRPAPDQVVSAIRSLL